MDFEVLGGLSGEERESFLARCTTRRYSRGDVILREGERGEEFHLIDAGRVSLHVSTYTGEVAMLSVLRAGQAFGEMALVGDRPRTATVAALEPVTTRAMPREVFDELRSRYPAVDRMLVDILASRVDRLSKELTEALYLPVEVRLARRLLALVAVYRAGADAVTVPMTQEEVAGLVGATRPTVNGVLNVLAASGVLELQRGRITVRDTAALSTLAAGDGA